MRIGSRTVPNSKAGEPCEPPSVSALIATLRSPGTGASPGAGPPNSRFATGSPGLIARASPPRSHPPRLSACLRAPPLADPLGLVPLEHSGHAAKRVIERATETLGPRLDYEDDAVSDVRHQFRAMYVPVVAREPHGSRPCARRTSSSAAVSKLRHGADARRVFVVQDGYFCLHSNPPMRAGTRRSSPLGQG